MKGGKGKRVKMMLKNRVTHVSGRRKDDRLGWVAYSFYFWPWTAGKRVVSYGLWCQEADSYDLIVGVRCVW